MAARPPSFSPDACHRKAPPSCSMDVPDHQASLSPGRLSAASPSTRCGEMLGALDWGKKSPEKDLPEEEKKAGVGGGTYSSLDGKAQKKKVFASLKDGTVKSRLKSEMVEALICLQDWLKVVDPKPTNEDDEEEEYLVFQKVLECDEETAIPQSPRSSENL